MADICIVNPKNINDIEKIVILSENVLFNLLISMPEYTALPLRFYRTQAYCTFIALQYGTLRRTNSRNTPSKNNTDTL